MYNHLHPYNVPYNHCYLLLLTTNLLVFQHYLSILTFILIIKWQTFKSENKNLMQSKKVLSIINIHIIHLIFFQYLF